jgi:type I restriction enzyme M protein
MVLYRWCIGQEGLGGNHRWQWVSEGHGKGKRQNQLTEEHIAKIIDTYQHRKEEPRYSRRVEMTEIEKNDFNLNISRYVSTAEAEVEIDLKATHDELVLRQTIKVG